MKVIHVSKIVIPSSTATKIHVFHEFLVMVEVRVSVLKIMWVGVHILRRVLPACLMASTAAAIAVHS